MTGRIRCWIVALSGLGCFEAGAAPTITAISNVSPSTAVVGQTITATVQVESLGAGAPTGSVTLGTGLVNETCVATLSASGPDTASGSCNFTPTFSALPLGSRNLVATYAGDPGFNPSKGAAPIAIDSAATTTTVSAPSSTAAQVPVNFNVATSVVAPGSGIPTGVIEVEANGPETKRCWVLLPETSCAIALLASGEYSVTAKYLGNPDYLTSTSSSTSITVTGGFPANNCNYIGPGTGSWNNPSHWSCGVVPGANDRATIAGGPELFYDVPGGGAVGEIVVVDASFTVNENLTIGQSLRVVSGSVAVSPSITLSIPSSASVVTENSISLVLAIEGSLSVAGQWNLQGGSAQIDFGAVTVQPSGRLIVNSNTQVFSTADGGSLNIDGSLLALVDTTLDVPGSDNGTIHVEAEGVLTYPQARTLGSLLSLRGRGGNYRFQTGTTMTLVTPPQRGIGVQAAGGGTVVELSTGTFARELTNLTTANNATINLNGSVVVLDSYGQLTSGRLNGIGGVRSVAVVGDNPLFSGAGSVTIDDILLKIYGIHEIRNGQLFDSGAGIAVLPGGRLIAVASSKPLVFECLLPSACAATFSVGGQFELTGPEVIQLGPDIAMTVDEAPATVLIQDGGLSVAESLTVSDGVIEVLPGRQLSVNGLFAQSGGDLRIADTAVVTTNAALQQSGGRVLLDGTLQGAITQTGGILEIGPGDPVGTVTGAFQQGPAGLLTVILGPMASAEKGPGCGTVSRLVAGNGLALNGNLRVLPDGCAVLNGTGPFTVVDGPAGFAQLPTLVNNPNAQFALALNGDDVEYIEQVVSTCTWNVDGPGAWNVAGNWSGCGGGSGSPAGTPGATDSVIVAAATPLANITLGGNRTVANLTLQAGVIGGAGNLTITGNVDWSGGEIAGVTPGVDTLAFGPSSTVTLSGSTKTVRSRTWNTNGSTTWTAGDIILAADTQVFNSGNFTVDVAGSASVSGDGAPLIQFLNAGSVVKSGIGNAVFTANARFRNNGSVNVQAGRLELGGAATDSGSYQTASDGILVFDVPAATRSLAAASSITGAGIWRKTGSGNLVFAGSYSHTGLAEMVGGQIDFSTSGTTVLLADALLEATITGDDAISLSGTMFWNGGEITASAGAPAFVVLSGATLDLIPQSPQQRILRNRLIQSSGNVIVNGTTLFLDGSASLDVSGTLNLSGSPIAGASIRCLTAPPCGGITIATAGVGNSNAVGIANSIATGVNVQLDGTLNVASNTLQLEGNVSTGAGTFIDVAGGATLGRTGTLSLNSGTLQGSGTIAADLAVAQVEIRPGSSPGILTVQGNFVSQSNTRYVMQATGVVPGSLYDQLSIVGNATLAGTLDALSVGGFVPASSDAFDFIVFTGTRNGNVVLGTNDFTGFALQNLPNAERLLGPGGPIVVDRSDDSALPAAQACTAAANDCTLRGAISTAVVRGLGAQIEFAIPGPGPHVIAPTSPLPTLPGNVRISGATQPGSQLNTEFAFGTLNMVVQIEIDGSSAGSNANGLVFTLNGGPSNLNGVSIHSFGGAQIVGNGAPGNRLFVFGSLIGLRADGTVGSGQAVGIRAAGEVTVGTPIRGPSARNVLAGFSEQALELASGGALEAQLNYIGTGLSGTSAFAANGRRGVYADLSGTAPSTLYLRNNVISGHDEDGIRLQCVAAGSACFNGAFVYSNRIGTSASGLAPVPNAGNGVNVSGLLTSSVFIGLEDGDLVGNIIRHNGGNGVLFTNASGNTGAVRVQGPNLINSNGGIAFDLGGDGRTANDASDADTGPNGLQNFPEFQTFVVNTSPDPDEITVDVLVTTPIQSSPNNYPMIVDVFLAEGDELGGYIGNGLLGNFRAARGGFTGTLTLPVPAGVTVNDDSVLVAIVTDAFNQSSELSFYATDTTIVSDTPDPTAAGDPYNVTVEVIPTAPTPFTTNGVLTISDGRGGSCVASLAPLPGAGSAGSCMLSTVGAPGPITLTAQFNAANTAFQNSSGTAAHTILGPLPTATTINGIAPLISVVGQPYTVAVSVTESGMPVSTGQVEVRQLTDNQVCTINLATSTSCQLTSTLAINTAVRATFLGAPLLAPSQSTTQAHTVERATTAIAIVSDSPDPSAPGQPITVTTTLNVIAPGAGIPTGEIFITDGVGSCSAQLPNLSCSFIPKNTGSFDLQARYQGDANFLSAIDSEPHEVTGASADLAVVKRNGVRLLPGGGTTTYVILVTNNGPQAVTNARVTDILPPQLTAATWTCSVTGGGNCPAAGTGNIDVLVSLASGAQATFLLTASVQANPEQVVTNTARVDPPLAAPDPNLANNESTDVDTIGFFADGFESENE